MDRSEALKSLIIQTMPREEGLELFDKHRFEVPLADSSACEWSATFRPKKLHNKVMNTKDASERGV